MHLVSVAQMRELDRKTIQEQGTPGEVLMDRAGFGVARVVNSLAEWRGLNRPFIRLIAGKGNNGGDAFVAARYLKDMGYDVDLFLTCSTSELSGDNATHFRRLEPYRVRTHELLDDGDWDRVCRLVNGPDVVVDGVLGTGVTGPARGSALKAIDYINATAHEAFVVAIDVPSGLNADSGLAPGAAVLADITVTMGLPKRGMVAASAIDYVGSVEVVDIGIPGEYVKQVGFEDNLELISRMDIKAMFKRRRRVSHKGTYGHVLLIGGACGYTGAIGMAAQSAIRSGVGLVTALVPEGLVPIVGTAVPEVMVSGGAETETGSLAAQVWEQWKSEMDQFDAILLGPGMTRHRESLVIARRIIRDVDIPLVLDADAITVFSGRPHWISRAGGPVVMTPHPGELAQLMGREIGEIQSDRSDAARSAANDTNAVVMLKGAGTIVAETGQPLAVNLTGNPGMATGGTGDVLAGLVVGLLGQGIKPYDAARAAVYLHSRAGDIVAWKKSQPGLVAGDIIQEIPYVFREVSLR